MGENLTTEAPGVGTLDLEKLRSHLKELSASLDDVLSSSADSIPEPEQLLEDFGRNLLAFSEDRDVEALGPADLEVYIEMLKKDLLKSTEENMEVSGEIDTLEIQVSADSTKLGVDVDSLLNSLNYMESKGMLFAESSTLAERPITGHCHGRQRQASEDYEFKILELSQQIEASRSTLNTLEDLHHNFKRLETICSLEDLFYGVKCIQFDNNCIRLSLRTPSPSMDSMRLKKKLDCSLEPTGLDHELLIEVTDKMELENIEIFPGDVNLDGIINAVKSSRFFPIHVMEDTLAWLVRQIQQRIILCKLRHFSVKNASNSSRSIVYSDLDETITSHLKDGLVASVKISQGWPLSSYPLKLRSLKYYDSHSENISWSLLCEVQEQAKSLDIHTRHDLTHFVDAIERLVIEMQTKDANSNASF